MEAAARIAIHEAGHAVAALTYGIPIIRVTIAADVPHLHRARYQPQHYAGLECLATLCLAGPAAEEYFCGPITDGADLADYQMARRYLTPRFGPLQIGAEIYCLRDAADRLVRTPSVQDRIRVITTALLRRGTLDAQAIAALG